VRAHLTCTSTWLSETVLRSVSCATFHQLILLPSPFSRLDNRFIPFCMCTISIHALQRSKLRLTSLGRSNLTKENVSLPGIHSPLRFGTPTNLFRQPNQDTITLRGNKIVSQDSKYSLSHDPFHSELRG